jgi:hypothetical protein
MVDGMHIEEMLYAGNIFASTVKRRPGIRLTIRQRTRVLQEWPSKPRE